MKLIEEEIDFNADRELVAVCSVCGNKQLYRVLETDKGTALCRLKECKECGHLINWELDDEIRYLKRGRD